MSKEEKKRSLKNPQSRPGSGRSDRRGSSTGKSSWIGEEQKNYDNLRKGAEVPPRPTKEDTDKKD